MRRPTAFGALTLVMLAQPLFAADRWLCFRSTNFELFTTSDSSSAREALIFFEQVRRAFTEILGIKLPEDKSVTIVAFRDEQSFAPYRPRDNVAAYTLAFPERLYLVMQDLVPEHYPVAMHEYTHVVINQAGMKLPLWLEEGFAELYATLTPMARKIVVGRVIPGRLQMAQAGLIDLREVLTADRRSALYREGDRTGIYYAESWALVHMLKFNETYSTKFDRVLELIGRGEASDRALQSVYNKPVGEIQSDLQNYVHSDHFREGVIHGKLDKAIPAPRPAEVDPIVIAVLLAGIEARGPRREDALQTLQQLARANPGKLLPIESLAWVQLNGPDPKTAIEPFRQALAEGTRDANLCFQFAVRLRSAIPESDYVAAVRRAAEIDPAFSAAQQQLAAHAFNSHDYAEAVRRLHLVRKLERSHAFAYYRALSFAAFQTGDLEEARSAAGRARQYAANPVEKGQADEMMKFVTGANPSKSAPGLTGNDLGAIDERR